MIQKWSDILNQYAEFAPNGAAYAGLQSLIGHIASTSLSQQLYGWLSMHELCIIQTPAIYPYNGPRLRLSPLTNGNIEFRYEDTAIKGRQWHREALPGEAVARLHQFLEHLHWIAAV